MNWQRIVARLMPAFAALALPGCAALSQKPDQVVTREPGHRTLGDPKPAYDDAREDRDFAWLADAAYGHTPAGQATRATMQAEPATADCPEPEAVLGKLGWERWPGFPDNDLGGKIAATHLRVEVWMHRDGGKVAVTFGGTVVGNQKDFFANARWFLPHAFLKAHPDEYSAIVQEFAPAFGKEYASKLATGGPWAFLQNARLYSTGHSLGGGLAQQFAYSIPLDAPKRVDKVYAFDPSPVTGFYSVDEPVREKNRIGLDIDRIYERGEVLALLRSLTSFIKQPTAENARIRGVRYSLFWPATPIGGHSISHLACGIERLVASAPQP